MSHKLVQISASEPNNGPFEPRVGPIKPQILFQVALPNNSLPDFLDIRKGGWNYKNHPQVTIKFAFKRA